MTGCTLSGKRFNGRDQTFLKTVIGVSVQRCTELCTETGTHCRGASYAAKNKRCDLFSTRDARDLVSDGNFVSINTACLGESLSSNAVGTLVFHQDSKAA